MCLEKAGEKQIASEDIIVYKFLKIENKVDINYKHIVSGNNCIAIIGNHKIIGKISIEDNEIYICHNNDLFDGISCRKTYGFKYSWKFDDMVYSLIINYKECGIKKIITPFQETPINIGDIYYSNLNKDTLLNQVSIGIHSFKNFNECYSVAVRYFSNYIFVKCLIPKGSEYYEGLFQGYFSYASNSLKYLETYDPKSNS